MRDLDYDIALEATGLPSMQRRVVEERRSGARGLVYFVQGSRGGPIKVGFANDLPRRLSALQNGAADELTVLLTVDGDRDLEAEVHRKFSRLRIRGEWFEPGLELLSFLKEARRLPKARP